MFSCTVYPKKYAHGFCFAVLCCGYTLTGFPISIRLSSLALWQSNDCPSASKTTLMDMDKYFMWIHYERLHNHNKAKHNKTVCIFLGIYCMRWLFRSSTLRNIYEAICLTKAECYSENYLCGGLVPCQKLSHFVIKFNTTACVLAFLYTYIIMRWFSANSVWLKALGMSNFLWQ